jgi:hypothetical protein
VEEDVSFRVEHEHFLIAERGNPRAANADFTIRRNDGEGPTSLAIKRCVPMQLRRRGVEQRIILSGGSTPTSNIDAILVRAIARGRRWFDQLASRHVKDTLEIAQCDGVPDSYVRRLMPLAFLAPSVVEAICSGRQPPDLTAERLTRRIKLPLCWTEQEKALGLTLANS